MIGKAGRSTEMVDTSSKTEIFTTENFKKTKLTVLALITILMETTIVANG